MPEPEKGDKVSWNWGGGAPGGTVAEKKSDGPVTITSKKGNEIKKKGEPGNPAVHVKRSGNDVVKKASELNIEKKNSKGSGEKRDHDESKKSDGEKPTVENSEGKEVRPEGKFPNKKQKQDSDDKKEDKEKAKKQDKDKDEEKDKSKPKANGVNGEKKKSQTKSEPKSKKESKPRNTEGVSSRTRSRAK